MKINSLKSLNFFLVVLLFSYQAYSQDSIVCQMQVNYDNNHIYSGDCLPDQNGAWATYRNMNTFIPDLDQNQPLHNPPVKTIEVCFNIIQKDNGTGNFTDNQATRDRLTAIINIVNNFYSSYGPSDPLSWVTELPDYDTRIRFSLGETGNERIYFYQNSSAWGSSYPYSIMEPIIQQNHPERLEQINVYITGNPNGYNWQHANWPS